MINFKKKKNNKKIIIIILSVAIITLIFGLSIFFIKNTRLSEEKKETLYANSIIKTLGEGYLFQDNYTKSNSISVDNRGVIDDYDVEEASSIILINRSDRLAIEAYNIKGRIYPASTTKILTCLVALKYGDLNAIVTVGSEALNIDADSTVAGIRPSDQLTLRDLLYGLMLPSGNDAAMAIGEYISGSSEEFVKLMNSEAKKIGATHSNFISPHGLHNEEHFTTGEDLYLIFNKALMYEEFRNIIGTSTYTSNVTHVDGSVESIAFSNTNWYLIGETSIKEDITIIGGKTGTTNEAGCCLVLLSKKDDKEYISLIMGSQEKINLYNKMTELLEKGISD